ncbi:MAG: (4Fe-4S)-binding protein [Ignavibacteriales bacterium]|nr:MAG: (4Fe-4S)-binding protein [Ignavibacteriales bacterium]
MSNEIHPREVANKSSKENLHKAITMALEVENEAIRHNTQTFNTNRYTAIKNLDDYELLKDSARQIKEYSIEHLPELIETLTKTIGNRGGKVFFAKTKKEATDYIKNVCKQHSAKMIVKAKSITSEEIGLNNVLEDEGIEVAETDLAEFILQVSKEQPSHIIAPAIHRSRERISELFKEHFDTAKKLDTGEELTEFARDILRQKFLSADVGISGANLIAADKGTILLVESEGNIRLVTQLPAVHIAVAGIEKIIPHKKDFGIFIELLARSGTGQPLTSYTNILEPSLELPVLNLNGRDDKEREFHLVLIDNGRMQMRDDDDLKEALYCVRCSACMNVCANFQAVGGHAFGGECYTGGIGGAWTVGTTGKLENGRFAELCTGCSRCIPNCPVRIDIPNLNTTIKNRLFKAGQSASFQKTFFANFSLLAKAATLVPQLSNWISNLSFSRVIMEKTIGFDKRRLVPPFANKTLVRQYQEYRNTVLLKNKINKAVPNTILFADVFTNYNNPEIGMSVIKVFEKLGIPITLSKSFEDGRAAQSQGLVESAEKSAIKVSAYLEKIINTGNEIIVAEPSVLAMFRNDYKKLIKNEKLFSKITQHTFDPLEFISIMINNRKLAIDKSKIKTGFHNTGLFYHGHCQMKTIGAGYIAPEFFKELGFNVTTSVAECCGMAGSFGYKKEYYELSKNVGADLIQQIQKTIRLNKDLIVLASGTSCREQIKDGLNVKVYHPIGFLEELLS